MGVASPQAQEPEATLQAEAGALAADIRRALAIVESERATLQIAPAGEDVEPGLGQLVAEVVFPMGAVSVRHEDRLRLAGVARTLSGLDVSRVNVVGYSDRTGPVTINTQLARQRAEIVADVLVDEGLRADAVVAISALDAELPLPVPTEEGVAEPRNRSARIFIDTP